MRASPVKIIPAPNGGITIIKKSPTQPALAAPTASTIIFPETTLYDLQLGHGGLEFEVFIFELF